MCRILSGMLKIFGIRNKGPIYTLFHNCHTHLEGAGDKVHAVFSDGYEILRIFLRENGEFNAEILYSEDKNVSFGLISNQ